MPRSIPTAVFLDIVNKRGGFGTRNKDPVYEGGDFEQWDVQNANEIIDCRRDREEETGERARGREGNRYGKEKGSSKGKRDKEIKRDKRKERRIWIKKDVLKSSDTYII